MAERHMIGSARPKPGPRPHVSRRPAEHGAAKRRTAHTGAPSPRRSAAAEPRRLRPRRERQPIDPRLNRKLWIAVGLLGLVAAVVAILEAPVFEARSTQLSGQARTSDGAILAALAIPEDQALLTYDTGAAAERVGALPWVDSVSVVRQWPSTVRVVVREHRVTAAVGDRSGQRWKVLGSDRMVLEDRPTPPSRVPLIVASDDVVDGAEIGASMSGVDRAYAIALDTPGQLEPWIASWSISDDGDVWANLVGTAHANFGPAGDHRTQFVSLASILDGGASLTCLRAIDLSIADTPLLERDPACLLASQDLGG